MKLKIIALSMLVSFAGVADEGMWQPHQLPELEAVLKSKGKDQSSESCIFSRGQIIY